MPVLFNALFFPISFWIEYQSYLLAYKGQITWVKDKRDDQIPNMCVCVCKRERQTELEIWGTGKEGDLAMKIGRYV